MNLDEFAWKEYHLFYLNKKLIVLPQNMNELLLFNVDDKTSSFLIVLFFNSFESNFTSVNNTELNIFLIKYVFILL